MSGLQNKSTFTLAALERQEYTLQVQKFVSESALVSEDFSTVALA